MNLDVDNYKVYEHTSD